MTETRERRKDGGEEGKSKERCKNPSCKRIEKEKQRSERGSSDKAKHAWNFETDVTLPCPSAASMEEEDSNGLCRSEERSQGDGDVGFCSAREETNVGGRDAE